MRDEPWLEALREAVRKLKDRSPEEAWDDMVRRGVIDEEGNVLLRMPEPPSPPKKTRKKSAKPSGRNGEPS
jgi:hypothetical protein